MSAQKLTIVVITCPCCSRFASLDGKYRQEYLGRTIAPAAANGYQPHCSACESMAKNAQEEADREASRHMVPAWFAEE